MKTKRILGSCVVAFILSLSIIKGVYAGEKTSSGHMEPFGYALLLAGGITLDVIRRRKSRRHSNGVLKEARQ